jgi:hypothetical protein
MNIADISDDVLLNILVNNELSKYNLDNLFKTNTKLHKIMKILQQNWFKIICDRQYINYTIFNCPLNTIDINKDIIINLLQIEDYQFIILHYIMFRYNIQNICNIKYIKKSRIYKYNTKIYNLYNEIRELNIITNNPAKQILIDMLDVGLFGNKIVKLL